MFVLADTEHTWVRSRPKMNPAIFTVPSPSLLPLPRSVVRKTNSTPQNGHQHCSDITNNYYVSVSGVRVAIVPD